MVTSWSTCLPYGDQLAYNAYHMMNSWSTCLPYGDQLAEVELVLVDLGDEDGCHSLIQRGAVHVDGGAYGQDESRNAPVDPAVLQQALHGDGEGRGAGGGGRGGGAKHADSSQRWGSEQSSDTSSFVCGVCARVRVHA